MTVVHRTAQKGLKNASDSSTDQDAPPVYPYYQVPSELDIDVATMDMRPNVAGERENSGLSDYLGITQLCLVEVHKRKVRTIVGERKSHNIV